MSSKMLDATCDAAGIVTSEGTAVQDAQVLSAGKASSSGVLLIEGEKARYIASNATDIQDLISKLVTIIEKISLIATGVDSASNSPGGQTANIAALTVLKTQLDSSKDLLK